MKKLSLKTLDEKCNALENVIGELVNLSGFMKSDNAEAKTRILGSIVYISSIAFMTLAIIEIYRAATVLTEYIAVYCDIIASGYSSKEMQLKLELISCISLPILSIFLVYPILILMGQTFGAIDERWILCRREFLSFYGVFMLLGWFFVSLSICIDYPIKLSKEVAPDQHIGFVLGFLSKKTYTILFGMIFCVVSLTLLFVRGYANKASVNKYAKLKHSIAELAKNTNH